MVILDKFTTANLTNPTYNLSVSQLFLKNYMSPYTDEFSLLVYHDTGVGKTCTAITIAESYFDLIDQGVMNKVLIIVKNDHMIRVFKDEMAKHTCTGHKYRIVKSGKTYLNRDLVNSHYEFKKYEEITKGTTDFSNRLIIIDEIHNMKTESRVDALVDACMESEWVKLVLLSATPLFDSIDEKLTLVNTLMSPYIKKRYTADDLTDDKLRKILKGRISYLRVNKENFPEKRLMSNSDNGYFELTMPDSQEEHYMNVAQGGLSIERAPVLLEACLTSYPKHATQLGIEADSTFEDIKNSVSLKTEWVTKIKKYSNKLYFIAKFLLDMIKNGDSSNMFIYSEYIESGVNIIYYFLNNIGTIRKNCNIFKYTGDLTPVERETILTSFRKVPTKINILIGSPAASESITLKNVNYAILISPFWNLSKTQQIIGRVIRNMSHASMPSDKRFVEVYNLLSIMDSNESTYEENIALQAIEKDKKIAGFNRILKESAADCEMNYAKNLLPSDFSGTRECDYRSCQFSCAMKTNKLIEKVNRFELPYHEKDIIKEKIKELFKIEYIWSFNDLALRLSNSITNPNVNILIEMALLELVDKENITDFFDIKGKIKNISGYYTFIPEKMNPENVNYEQLIAPKKLPEEQVVHSRILLTKKKPLPVAEKDVIKGVYKGSKQEFAFATLMKGETRYTSGAICTKMVIKDILEVAKKIGIQEVPGTTKDAKCKYIEEFMIKNNLLIG